MQENSNMRCIATDKRHANTMQEEDVAIPTPRRRLVKFSLQPLPLPAKIKESLIKINPERIVCDATSLQYLQVPIISDRDEVRDDMNTRAATHKLAPRDQPQSRHISQILGRSSVYVHQEPMMARRGDYFY
jgi:hypothetical protein